MGQSPWPLPINNTTRPIKDRASNPFLGIVHQRIGNKHIVELTIIALLPGTNPTHAFSCRPVTRLSSFELLWCYGQHFPLFLHWVCIVLTLNLTIQSVPSRNTADWFTNQIYPTMQIWSVLAHLNRNKNDLQYLLDHNWCSCPTVYHASWTIRNNCSLIPLSISIHQPTYNEEVLSPWSPLTYTWLSQAIPWHAFLPGHLYYAPFHSSSYNLP